MGLVASHPDVIDPDVIDPDVIDLGEGSRVRERVLSAAEDRIIPRGGTSVLKFVSNQLER